MALSPKKQAWLDALEEAYYSGILEVTHGDRTVKYRSLLDIKKAIGGLTGDGSGTIDRRYAEFTRD